jgi:hypothetical protein
MMHIACKTTLLTLSTFLLIQGSAKFFAYVVPALLLRVILVMPIQKNTGFRAGRFTSVFRTLCPYCTRNENELSH